MNWYLKCIKESYADFKGRARRSEFWYFSLFNLIVAFALGIIVSILRMPYIMPLYSFAIFIPSTAVAVRRLHDIGKSGWFFLIGLIPIIGGIWLLILYCKDSQPEANQWGANPKA